MYFISTNMSNVNTATLFELILSRATVTKDGVRSRNWIY
jgi:hypothetical protein